MRMRTLIHLILGCLIAGMLVAPTASAHSSGRGDDRSNERSRHHREKDRHGKHGKHGRGGRDGRGDGVHSFFGAQADGRCSKETRSCDFTFSRSVSSELYERLEWLLTEKMDAVESFAERLCSRAEKENECAGTFVAGLWNGLDALEIAVAEGSCGTLVLSWTKTEGLSQSWGITNDGSCTD